MIPLSHIILYDSHAHCQYGLIMVNHCGSYIYIAVAKSDLNVNWCVVISLNLPPLYL
jgi:hypothetical protein